jgi:hypothetical protein
MKKYLVFVAVFLFIGGVFFANAQDMIVLKDGKIIEAKVLEISPSEIRYKRFEHLDGPTIVVMAVDVLSIRYENGRTEIINATTQPETTTQIASTLPTEVQIGNDIDYYKRLNTIGFALGYQGVSAFGFSLNGTVSPANYTFFDFNLGLGFNSFAFNGSVNFNAFVPFKSSGWHIGIGIGGGYNELFGGVFSGNLTTGFMFFNWLNIAYILQIGTFDDIVNHNIVFGYSYRFNNKNDKNTSSKSSSATPSNETIEISENYTVVNISGDVYRLDRESSDWVKVNIGESLNRNTRIELTRNSSLDLTDGNTTITITGRQVGRLDRIIAKL